MKSIGHINIYDFSGVVRAEKPHVQHSFPWITINLTLRVLSKEKMLFNLSFRMQHFSKLYFFLSHYIRKKIILKPKKTEYPQRALLYFNVENSYHDDFGNTLFFHAMILKDIAEFKKKIPPLKKPQINLPDQMFNSEFNSVKMVPLLQDWVHNKCPHADYRNQKKKDCIKSGSWERKNFTMFNLNKQIPKIRWNLISLSL